MSWSRWRAKVPSLGSRIPSFPHPRQLGNPVVGLASVWSARWRRAAIGTRVASSLQAWQSNSQLLPMLALLGLVLGGAMLLFALLSARAEAIT